MSTLNVMFSSVDAVRNFVAKVSNMPFDLNLGAGSRIVFFQAEDGIRDHCVTGVQDVCSSDLSFFCAYLHYFNEIVCQCRQIKD